ncbi:undecaprenyl diphosphate synthase family protein, partial [Campylobacter sp. RM12321]
SASYGDVDLLIRTGGEIRLSNFMLWEASYAELEFTDTFWPDFNSKELDIIIKKFEKKHRRFGGL